MRQLEKEDQCGEAYAGKTFPQHHGTRCIQPLGHEALEPTSHAHVGYPKGPPKPLRWYSVWQKELREGKKEPICACGHAVHGLRACKLCGCWATHIKREPSDSLCFSCNHRRGQHTADGTGKCYWSDCKCPAGKFATTTELEQIRGRKHWGGGGW